MTGKTASDSCVIHMQYVCKASKLVVKHGPSVKEHRQDMRIAEEKKEETEIAMEMPTCREKAHDEIR